jgi:hypothetical protein
MSSDNDSNNDAGCGCIAYLLSTGGIVWLLSSYLGFWKAVLVGLVMTLTTWVLSLFGIIPILGQWLYKLFAKGAITWVYGLLHANQNIRLSIPGWVNFVLKWIMGEGVVTGSLASYTFDAGYLLSIGVSITIVVVIIIRIASRRSE